MIKIGKPFVADKGDKSVLYCSMTDDGLKKKYDLWFSVESKYRQFITFDSGDAFVLIALQIAMKSGQNILCECPISDRLMFNMTNGVMPLINTLYPEQKPVSIKADTISLHRGGMGVGTGCSLGIDSFSTIIDLMSDKFPIESKLTHVALFNSGQLGDNDLQHADNQFYKEMNALGAPVKELGLELVGINSNVNQLYKDYNFPLLHRFITTTCAFPLVLQSLFKSYIYASSYPIVDFSLDPSDISHIEHALVPLLGTESTCLSISNPTFTRVDKTLLVSTNRVAKKYLNVCWSNQLYNMYGDDIYLKNKTKLNCGICDKCMRTLFTLEVIGRIDDFKEIFDIGNYLKYRNKYLVKVLAYHNKDHFLEEIYEYMMLKGYKIPVKAKILALLVKVGVYDMVQKLFGVTVMAHGKSKENKKIVNQSDVDLQVAGNDKDTPPAQIELRKR